MLACRFNRWHVRFLVESLTKKLTVRTAIVRNPYYIFLSGASLHEIIRINSEGIALQDVLNEVGDRLMSALDSKDAGQIATAMTDYNDTLRRIDINNLAILYS